MGVDGLSVALRALSFVALFQAAGLAIFVLLFETRLTITASITRRLGVLATVAALVLVISHYALEAGRMSGDFAGVWDSELQALVMNSSTSTALVLRVAGLMLILFGLLAKHPSSRAVSVLGIALAVGAFTVLGHTTTHPLRWLSGPLLFLHLLVVAFWFGALAPLAIASARESAAIASAAIDAFSRAAIWVVPGLFTAGFLVAVILLSSLDVFSMTYGRLLLAKAAGFAILMIPATLNKWWLAEAIARGESGAVTNFRRSVAIEGVLIAAVLTVTAVMTTFFSPDET